MRLLYFYRQRLALTSLVKQGILQPSTGLERKVRKEKKTWFSSVPAWAGRCTGLSQTLSYLSLIETPKTNILVIMILQMKRQRSREVL